MRVKDLIKILVDFNPNAEITNEVDIGWGGNDISEVNGERDIEHEMLTATRVTLWYPDGGDQENE